MSNIHPTAVVHPTAKIDPTAQIGPYAVIGEDTVIGPGCSVGPHAVIEFTHMGKENRMFSGCYLGTAPQDLKYKGEHALLVMGDRNVVREGVTLNRGTSATGKTVIGSNCLFTAYTHVAHDCRVGSHVIMVSFAGLAGHVELGDYSVLSVHVGIHQFVRVGRFVMISAGSKVGKDIPSFCVAQGDRARLRGLNVVGLRRSGLPRTTTKAIKDAYKTLFLSGLQLKPALAQIKSTDMPPEVAEMVEFIEKSPRGITRPDADEKETEEVAS